MNATERRQLAEELARLKAHYIDAPQAAGKPVDKADLWSWLQAAIALETLDMLGHLHDHVIDLDNTIEQRDTDLEKIIEKLQKIQENTAPD